MQFLTRFAILLVGSSFVSAVPVAKRTAATVLADISTISSDLATVSKDAKAYTGTLLQSLALGIDVTTLLSAITAATSATTGSAAFTAAESTSIVTSVTTLTPAITAVLAELDTKFAIVSSAGYASLVGDELTTLTTDTDALFTALAAKVVTPTSITALKATVDAAFATAAALY